MSETEQEQRSVCPVSYALEIFGDRWSLLVLRDVLLKHRFRYKEFMAASPGLATNILTDRLKRLEGRGILMRLKDPKDGRQYLYLPTDQAIALIPMLLEMVIWSSEQGSGSMPAGFTGRYHNDRDALIEDLKNQVRKAIAPYLSE